MEKGNVVSLHLMCIREPENTLRPSLPSSPTHPAEQRQSSGSGTKNVGLPPMMVAVPRTRFAREPHQVVLERPWLPPTLLRGGCDDPHPRLTPIWSRRSQASGDAPVFATRDESLRRGSEWRA